MVWGMQNLGNAKGGYAHHQTTELKDCLFRLPFLPGRNNSLCICLLFGTFRAAKSSLKMDFWWQSNCFLRNVGGCEDFLDGVEYHLIPFVLPCKASMREILFSILGGCITLYYLLTSLII